MEGLIHVLRNTGIETKMIYLNIINLLFYEISIGRINVNVQGSKMEPQ